MTRVDIDEGEALPEQAVCFGRIRSLPELRERYFSLLLFGWRFFIAVLYPRGMRVIRWRFFNVAGARREYELFVSGK